MSATGSKVFVCFYGDGITPNNTATLGYLAKKTSDEQPMAYISSCRFLIYTNIYIYIERERERVKSSPMFVLEGFEFHNASHIIRSAMDW